jgi:hypothetical protein
MTRTSFLAFFGLGAAGQQKQTGYRKPPWVRREYGVYSAINGECPCCGTQAPPYRPVPPPMCGDSIIVLEDGTHTSGCNPILLPKRTQVECAHCRVVFGQDAEGETK